MTIPLEHIPTNILSRSNGDDTGGTVMETKTSAGSRTTQITALGFTFITICILFTIAFNDFQPDQYSLSDRYFPSSTPTNTRTPTLTPTPTFTPTNTFTPTVTATPTPDYLLTVVTRNNVIFEDHFDTNENNWGGFYSGSTVTIENGKLNLLSENSGFIGVSFCITCPETGDSFFLEAELAVKENKTTSYGLAFCSNGYGADYYVFQIKPIGKTFILYKHSDTGWQNLTENQYSSAIEMFPAANKLGVYYDHGAIKLYINDKNVLAYEDKAPYSCKRSGFFVNGSGVNLLADNLTVYDIQAAP